MKWFLGFLLHLLIEGRAYVVGQAACHHPVIDIVSGSIEQTAADGRWWNITVQCQGCGETWRDLKVKTRHAF